MRPQPDAPGMLELIADRLIGGESMRQICQDPQMPAERQVYIHMARDEAFRSTIASAREAQQDALIDETVDLADAATAEDHQVVKLRIWARQWRAGKLAPKKYGDAVQMKHSGSIGHFDASKYTDEQLEQLENVLGPLAVASGDAAGGEGGEDEAGG